MIVVDASIAIKWVLPEEDSDLALSLLADHIVRGERVLAPLLLVVEASNVIRQQMRRNGVGASDARAMLDRLLALPFDLWPLDDPAQRSLSQRALLVAMRYDLSATYDAHYLALAELLGCGIWTADERLLRQLDNRAPGVHDLAAYQPDE